MAIRKVEVLVNFSDVKKQIEKASKLIRKSLLTSSQAEKILKNMQIKIKQRSKYLSFKV